MTQYIELLNTSHMLVLAGNAEIIIMANSFEALTMPQAVYTHDIYSLFEFSQQP